MQAIGSMGIGLLLAFIYGWKMSLVILAFVPFIVIAGAAQTKLMVGFSAEVQKRLIDGGKVAHCTHLFTCVVPLLFICN